MDKHDLHHEFPEYDELIHVLKVEDKHFRKMFDKYHLIDKDIHRIRQQRQTQNHRKGAPLQH